MDTDRTLKDTCSEFWDYKMHYDFFCVFFSTLIQAIIAAGFVLENLSAPRATKNCGSNCIRDASLKTR